MNKKFGVIGHRGKLGSLLVQRPNFVPIDCDITNTNSIYEGSYKAFGEEQDYDVVINLAGISSIDECEKNYDKAIAVNCVGHYNVHKVLGPRVIYPSSDYVFSGKGVFLLPNERTKPSPINNYGFSKLGGEAISQANGGKIIRLSRSVSVFDDDIREYLLQLSHNKHVHIPTFLRRNYLSRKQMVNGLEYFANHYDELPDIIHFGNYHNTDMATLMKMVADKLGFDRHLVQPRNYEEQGHAPRPNNGGFRITKKKDYPIYYINDTVSNLAMEYRYFMELL